MAEMLMDGIGSANFAIVDNAHRLYTTGSITSMPKVTIGSVYATVDSIYIQSGDNINITSLPGDLGSVVISESTKLGVSGIVEISSLPAQMGSVGVTALPGDLGSVVISSSTLLGVSGDKLDNLAGSFGVTALPGDLGSVVISSSSLLGISGNVFTEGKIVGSFAPKGIGSVVIKSAPLIGVSGAIFDSGNITGSMVISSASLIGVSGLIFTDGKMTGSFHPAGIGSVVISSAPVLGVSGAKLDALTGSFYNIETTPTAIINNNPQYKFEYVISGTSTGVIGSKIGSITQFIGLGSYVQIITWANNKATNIGSWI